MSHVSRAARCVLLLVIGAFGATCAAPAGVAHAGYYNVYACESGAGTGVNYLFGNTSGGAGAANPGCTYGYGLHTVIYGGALLWANGSLTFNAPAGTAITQVSLSNYTEWQGGGFARQIDDGVTAYYGGALYDSFWVSTHGWDTPTLNTWTGSIRLISFCAANPQCTGNNANTRWSDIRVQLYNGTNPGFTAADGLWQNNGWVRGQHYLGLASTDDVGVKRQGVQRGADGGYAIYDETYTSCDYHYAIPCPSASKTNSVNLSSTPDGARGLRVFSFDSADNLALAEKTIYVDNTPPVVTPASGTSPYDNAASWTVSDASSGLKVAALTPQYSSNGGQSWQAMTGGTLVGSTYTARLPSGASDGTYQVRLTAADNAADWWGTPNSATSTTSSMTFDSTPPAAPTNLVISPAQWSASDAFTLTWANPPSQTAPIAGAHIRRCPAGVETGCSTTYVAGANLESASVVVPGIGEYDYSVWLQDSEGNANAANRAGPARARRGQAPEVASAPAIDGIAQQGRTLNASSPTIVGTPSPNLQRRWEREVAGQWEVIDNESSASYTLTAADVGHRVRHRLSATNVLGDDAAVSEPTSEVAPALASTASASLVNADEVGRVALYDRGAWVGAGSVTFGPITFWSCSEPLDLDAGNLSACAEVDGYAPSDDPSMPVQSEHVGRYIAVTQTASDEHGDAMIVARSLDPVAPRVSSTQASGRHLRVLSTSWTGSSLRVYARCYLTTPCVGTMTIADSDVAPVSYAIPGASTRTLSVALTPGQRAALEAGGLLRLRGSEYLVTHRFEGP